MGRVAKTSMLIVSLLAITTSCTVIGFPSKSSVVSYISEDSGGSFVVTIRNNEWVNTARNIEGRIVQISSGDTLAIFSVDALVAGDTTSLTLPNTANVSTGDAEAIVDSCYFTWSM